MTEGLNPKITVLQPSDDKYGKFVVEPLERGFGETLGNAFRRVLLAHIPGAAITYVRIDGALHEFSTLPGVAEDSTEIILNIKELAIKVHSSDIEADEELRLWVDVTGEGEVTGKDVHCPPNVEILNPDLHLATITDANGKLRMDLWVELGKGYLPAEGRERQHRGIDVVPIDAVFSPVARAAYAVEPTRLGHRTDLDRLVLEIWGDGTVHPEQALKTAAKNISQYLAIFLGPAEEEPAVAEAETVEGEVASPKDRVLDLAIEDVDFSVRTFNCLKKEGINTLRDLTQRTAEDLIAIRNFGSRSLKEVIDKLNPMGLKLKEPPGGEDDLDD
jgi:DNA-directed RNA polymerase subunit alpha